MRGMSFSLHCSVVLICVTQYLVYSDDDILDVPNHQSAIDKFIPDEPNPQFTTRCYEDIQPLSVEIDGAPGCAPVVYGDENDFRSEDNLKTDDEVRKLREEFFKKHRKDKAAPEETKNEGAVSPDGFGKDYGFGKSEQYLKTDDEVNKLREEFFKKQKNEIKSPDHLKREGFENKDIFREEDLEGLNEIDLQKNILKQHWNAHHVQEDLKENKPKQHWNRDSIEKINNKEKKITLIPGENSEPGYKHDDLQRNIHEEIYGDHHMGNMNKVKIVSKQKDLNKLEKKKEIKSSLHNVHKVNNIHNQLKSLLNFESKTDNKENFKYYKKLMDIELRETTNPHQHDRVYGPSCGLKKVKTNLWQ